ncbi:MAG: hypothetical protein KME07_02620 [Pegethrix bostrychoides GSE-TBD4-15B]|jgi:hypothetical protein|uniref:Uncharacterized protein n=1 Tax=Pegethrix bostrychoides GSE-TBD4-15B TaxID=2839662 RepID=A0A951P872_9CYAN|nr:hypothetical protein [Pegethrix bostrychoides GSE-TBD4-15B]
MESSQASLSAQAKQGDAKAIATLLNYKLQPKGITAKTSIKGSCLHIMLEAAKTPVQKPLVDFLRKSFAGFMVDAWCTVRVYGRQVGEEIPDWAEEFKVEPRLNQDLAALAKQGDVKAISTLVNQRLQSSSAVAKVNLKDDCLQIMIEATEVPNQEKIVLLLQSVIQELGLQSINKLKLYGKLSGEDFPDWQEEVRLLTGKSDLQETQAFGLDLSLSSKTIKQASPLSTVQEFDSIGLSNQLYTILQTTCYQHLSHKINSEDDKSIHEIVEDFIDELETDLKLDIDQFTKQAVSSTQPFGLKLNVAEIQTIVSDIMISDFAKVRLAKSEI